MATKSIFADGLVLPKVRAMLDAIGIETILRRVANGEPLQVIARTLGMEDGSLRWWIETNPDYSARLKDVRKLTAAAWDERAQAGIEDAQDMFELAKAKELAHHYRWRASKIAPKIYGEKLEIEQNVKVTVDIGQRKEQLRQMLDINPAPRVTEQRPTMALHGQSALESVLERGIANDGPLNTGGLVTQSRKSSNVRLQHTDDDTYIAIVDDTEPISNAVTGYNIPQLVTPSGAIGVTHQSGHGNAQKPPSNEAVIAFKKLAREASKAAKAANGGSGILDAKPPKHVMTSAEKQKAYRERQAIRKAVAKVTGKL